jgi:hypothetical protein
VHVLTWPKTRRLAELSAEVSPGRLVLTAPGGVVLLDCTDPDELRAFAMQAYAAALDRDGAVREAAVKASLARRRPGGLRHRPFVDVPEPPAHMEATA